MLFLVAQGYPNSGHYTGSRWGHLHDIKFVAHTVLVHIAHRMYWFKSQSARPFTSTSLVSYVDRHVAMIELHGNFCDSVKT